MTDDLSRVLREAERAANGRGANIVEMLAERVGLRAAASAVFGDPVERDGVTVIPVAKVRWGFGGGSGRGLDDESGDVGEGSGGGGGAMASPIGFIEIQDGVAIFKRTHDPMSAVPIILASGFAAWLCLRGIKKIIRG
ncbi:MAG: spore germination protein GerW family protein [Tepidiformaceae bacterium]